MFENYVRKHIFDYKRYELLERSPRFTDDPEQFALSALKPDFRFRERSKGIEFMVEVKFRRRYHNSNEINWSKPWQLARYQDYARECPTFLLLGLGEDPERPNMLGLIPMEKAKYPRLFLKVIREHKIAVDQPVSLEVLFNDSKF